MNNARVQDFVSELLSDRANEEALVRRARELAGHPNALEQIRENWPRCDYPIIAEYLCCKRLGHGSSGVVYKAIRFGRTPEWVALKVLRHSGDQDTVRFIEREIEILKALDCPNVARYLDAGQSAGSHYLAMELVEGIPLDEFVEANATTLECKLRIFERVCDVVEAVHAQGVVHRDLTPRHFLVDVHGQPRLVDFGLSTVQSDDWATRVRKTQTQLGRIMGTVKYMSPEQTWGGMIPIDQGSDIWALGVMLFELATDGDYPYSLEAIEGKNAGDSLLHRIQHEVPRKPRITDARYASGLATLISRCLASEPRRRIESASRLGEDIASLRKRSAIKTKPLPLPYKLQRVMIGMMLRSRTAVWMLIVAGVVLAMSSGSRLLGIDFGTLEDDHSTQARTQLIKAKAVHGSIDFVLVGIGDDTARHVIEFARSNGIEQVTTAVPSWRAVHGQLMTRLAETNPMAVVWDFYFRSQQPSDPELVEGIRSLDRAGIPVALAVTGYFKDGTPDLSPGIYDPLREIIHHGLILARDMVERPGEFVIALQRGNQTMPSLPLATLGAICYPHLQSDVSWKPGADTLTVQHRVRGTQDYVRGIDRIQVKTLPRLLDGRSGTQIDDWPATKVFDLTPLQKQESRTVAYEDVLSRSAASLKTLVDGKIIVFIDTRNPSPLPWIKRDRHAVKYATGIVDSVPGGYLLADAIDGLISSTSINRRHWLPPQAYTLTVGMAVVGCLVASLISRRGSRRSLRTHTATVGIFIVFTLACIVATFNPLARQFADWAIGGAAAGTAVILALSVEYMRNLHRYPGAPDTKAHAFGSR